MTSAAATCALTAPHQLYVSNMTIDMCFFFVLLVVRHFHVALTRFMWLMLCIQSIETSDSVVDGQPVEAQVLCNILTLVLNGYFNSTNRHGSVYNISTISNIDPRSSNIARVCYFISVVQFLSCFHFQCIHSRFDCRVKCIHHKKTVKNCCIEFELCVTKSERFVSLMNGTFRNKLVFEIV